MVTWTRRDLHRPSGFLLATAGAEPRWWLFACSVLTQQTSRVWCLCTALHSTSNIKKGREGSVGISSIVCFYLSFLGRCLCAYLEQLQCTEYNERSHLISVIYID